MAEKIAEMIDDLGNNRTASCYRLTNGKSVTTFSYDVIYRTKLCKEFRPVLPIVEVRQNEDIVTVYMKPQSVGKVPAVGFHFKDGIIDTYYPVYGGS